MQKFVVNYLRKPSIETLLTLLDSGITEEQFKESIGLIDSIYDIRVKKYTSKDRLVLLELWHKLIVELGWSTVFTQDAVTEIYINVGSLKKLVNKPRNKKYKGYYTSEFYSKLIKLMVFNPNNTKGIEYVNHKIVKTKHNIYDQYGYFMDLDRKNGVVTSWPYDDGYVDAYLKQSNKTYLNKLNYLDQLYINTSIFYPRHSHLTGTVIDRQHQQAKERVQELKRQAVRALSKRK